MNILVIAEHNNKELNQASLSALAAACEIINVSNNQYNLDVLIAGHNDDGLSSVKNRLAGLGIVNKIIIADNKIYEHQLAEDYTNLVLELAPDYRYVILPATTFGKNLAPRIAAQLDVNPLSDVVSVESEDVFVRPIYAGNAIAKFKLHDIIKVLTVRTTSFSLDNLDKSKFTVTESQELKLDTTSSASKNLSVFVEFNGSKSERPELASADIVVSGGRALQSEENFKLIYDLADALDAAVGASRAAVDAGYVPNDYQVGQTGKVVAPSLYIAVGISGAIQHVAGMQESKIVVAINKDPDAAIFNIADYGLVGDLFTIVPEFIQKLKALKK